MNKKLHAFNSGKSSLVTKRLMTYLFPLILLLMIGRIVIETVSRPIPVI